MSEDRHGPCATCGICCRSYLVPVCGHDVWLISTRQRLGPEEFLVPLPQQEPGLDGFRLGVDGPACGLVLDKRGRRRAAQPCVFLMALGGGTERCGIYAERPVVCRAYPMSIVARNVALRGDARCPPGSWPDDEVVRPAWRDALQGQRMHFDLYHEVVARWNARVAAVVARMPGARLSLPEYFSYVLNAYDRLAALDGELGAPELERVRAGWGRGLRAAAGAADGSTPATPPPWLEYFFRARAVIDGLYPAIAPQPYQLRGFMSPEPEQTPMPQSPA